jgi:DNA-binding transcriptional MerR regulator
MEQEPSAPRLVTIGAVSERLGVAPSTVRLWERKGWIPPADRLGGSNRRVYDLADLDTLRTVADARRRQPATAPVRA